MSDSFAQSIQRLAAIASQVLGWSPDTFWRATPAELASALADPNASPTGAPLSRTDLETLLERDRNG